MIKLFREGNYIYFIDEDNLRERDFARVVSIQEREDAKDDFIISSPKLGVRPYNIANIKKKDGSDYTGDELLDWADINTGADVDTISTEEDVTFNTVTVTKTATVSLLAANPARLGAIFSNIGTQDVLIKFAGPAGVALEGFVVKAGTTYSLTENESKYKGEISAIRATTIGTQTSDVRITEF